MAALHYSSARDENTGVSQTIETLQLTWIDAISAVAPHLGGLGDWLSSAVAGAHRRGRLGEAELLDIVARAMQRAGGACAPNVAHNLDRRLRQAVYEFLLAVDATASIERAGPVLDVVPFPAPQASVDAPVLPATAREWAADPEATPEAEPQVVAADITEAPVLQATAGERAADSEATPEDQWPAEPHAMTSSAPDAEWASAPEAAADSVTPADDETLIPSVPQLEAPSAPPAEAYHPADAARPERDPRPLTPKAAVMPSPPEGETHAGPPAESVGSARVIMLAAAPGQSAAASHNLPPAGGAGWSVRERTPAGRVQVERSTVALGDVRRKINEWMGRKRFADVAAVIQQVCQEVGGQDAATLAVETGDLCLTRSKRLAATSCYIAALRADPVSEAALTRLAEMCIEDQQLDTALAHLDRVVQLARLRGDEGAALDALRHIATLAPHREDVLALLVQARMTGQLED
ncbi:MAG: hypothetical protein ABR564_08305 [Candidatus Dormibacteria bacterium]